MEQGVYQYLIDYLCRLRAEGAIQPEAVVDIDTAIAKLYGLGKVKDAGEVPGRGTKGGCCTRFSSCVCVCVVVWSLSAPCAIRE